MALVTVLFCQCLQIIQIFPR